MVTLCTVPCSQVKHCSVMLDRLDADEKVQKKELEDKEDMNRKGGKPVSRIPTFQKRPVGTSQTTELPVPRRDPPVHVDRPAEKAAGESVEVLKSKPADVRETALPLPSVRIPKAFCDVAHVPGSVDLAAAAGHSPMSAAPKGWSLSEAGQSLFASPRPALRPQQGTSATLEAEAGSNPDTPESHLPHESALSQKTRFVLTASGDTEKSAGVFDFTEATHVETIIDEEPPWEAEPMETAEWKDSQSSSDAEGEKDLGSEGSESDSSEHLEAPAGLNLEEERTDVSRSEVSSSKSSKVSYVRSSHTLQWFRSACFRSGFSCFGRV